MWKYYNANALGNSVNDCVVRAISKAENKTWDKTYRELSDIAQREGILLDDVNFVEEYLDRRYPRVRHYAKTVEEFAKEYSKGRYLVTMQGHITTIIDGVIYDTFNCGPRRMWAAWKVK